MLFRSIILATDRRLGAGSETAWKLSPASAATTDIPFSVIEIRTDAKGVSEGKTSLTSKVIVDEEAKTLTIENYAAAPTLLKTITK